MMTHEENIALTGVSPGTPLHEPLSRYWYPIMRSVELKDRCTLKARLLGVNFVIARIGDELLAMDELCPHRQASLTLARAEDNGLRCIYHGWLMDRDGAVIETPNERETGGRQQVRLRTAAIREAGGLIWMNICTSEAERAPFPDLPWMHLPAEQIVIVNAMCRTNWVQSLEGVIDSSHSSHLHSDEIISAKTTQSSSAIGDGSALQFARPSTDKHPRIKVRDTDCGFIYGAIRKPIHNPETTAYIRASAYAYPSYVTVPSSATMGSLHVPVPIDESHTYYFHIRYSTCDAALDQTGMSQFTGLMPGTDIDERGYMRISSLPSWGQDRAAMAAGKSFTGLKGVTAQDIVVVESMGLIVDRTKEHLGAADLAIVHFRRLLLNAARGEGAARPGFASSMRYDALVARDGLLPLSQDWSEIYPAGAISWKTVA